VINFTLLHYNVSDSLSGFDNFFYLLKI